MDIGDVAAFKETLDIGIKCKIWLKWKNYIYVNGEHIDGYYLKNHEESIPEKMLKEFKKITTNNGTGEDWKSSDS